MKLKELQHGMRITFAYGNSLIVNYYTNGRLYVIGKTVPYNHYNDNMRNLANCQVDINKVEDLDENGNYYTIWERHEPTYYILPKGIEFNDNTVLNYKSWVSEWTFASRVEFEGYQTRFTIEEMVALGLDPDNYKKIPV